MTGVDLLDAIQAGDRHWRAHAACADHYPDLWFPERGEWDIAKAARRICHTCPVRRECVDQAFRTDERFGIWGGLTPYQRTTIRGRLASR